MNIHFRYKELRSVGEYEHAEAEASVSCEVPEDADLAQEFERLRRITLDEVKAEIEVARRLEGIRIGDQVVSVGKYSSGFEIWTVEEITNQFVYCVQRGEERLARQRFEHSQVEKATPKLLELAWLKDQEVR